MANQITINKVSKDATIVTLVAPASTVNGSLLAVGSKNTDGTFAAAAPAAVTDTNVALVATPTDSYEAEKVDNDFVIATSALVRAYIPYVGFTITVPVANITATAAITKDYVVVPKASAVKMECLATVAGTEAVVFTVEELLTENGVASVTLRCIKA